MFPAPRQATLTACLWIALYFALTQFLVARRSREEPLSGKWIADWPLVIAMIAPLVALGAIPLIKDYGAAVRNLSIATALIGVLATVSGVRAAERMPRAATRRVDLRPQTALVTVAVFPTLWAAAIAIRASRMPSPGAEAFIFAVAHAVMASFLFFNRRSGLWRAAAGGFGLLFGVGDAVIAAHVQVRGGSRSVFSASPE